MKVLILDDDTRRASKLKEQIVLEVGIDNESISTETFADEALGLLKIAFFDVFIIDVMIPRRSGESANPKHGVDLLRKIEQGRGLRKPRRILGITANIRDIEKYRDEFAASGIAVVQALPGNMGWRKTICQSIQYERDSSLSSAVSSNSIEVITIHGIQTFGGWQKRLERIANNAAGDLRFGTYKYGVFSFVSFMIPPLRSRESRKLAHDLKERFQRNPDKKFIIFCHSFGTYLAYNAINQLLNEDTSERFVPVHTLVLSGSVLKHRTSWSKFTENSIRVVNDCADQDNVLYLSQCFVWGVGMAGRCGFYGFNDELVVNRYFNGGHSSYFLDDRFMQKYWIPLISTNTQTIPKIDLRRQNFIRHSIFDKLALAIGGVTTLFIYCMVTFLLAFGFFQGIIGAMALL